MGEDLIYQIKKMLPRFIILLFGVLFGFVFVLLFFSKWIEALWLFGILFCGLAFLFFFIGFEYFRSKRLVRGKIGGLEISDLTRAIYWLSMINSGNANFSFGGFHYWINVEDIVRVLGGSYFEEWLKLTKNYKLPTSRKIYSNVIILLLCMPFLFAVQLLDLAFSQSMLALGLIFVVVLGVLALTGRYLITLKRMATKPEVKKITGYLLDEITAWVSSKSIKPIRVVVADGVYPNAEPVGSLLGYLIIGMPKRSFKQHPVITKIPVLRKQVTSLAIYLVPAILIGYSIILRSLQRFIEKPSLSSIFLVLMGIGILVLFEFLLYWFTPMFRGIFRGNLSPSDFALVVKRLPKGMLFSYSKDHMLKGKIKAILEIHKQNSLKIEMLPESIRLWIEEDIKSPSDLAYFVLSEDSVELTSKGTELAEVLMKKLGDLEAQKRLLDLLNSES